MTSHTVVQHWFARPPTDGAFYIHIRSWVDIVIQFSTELEENDGVKLRWRENVLECEDVLLEIYPRAQVLILTVKD